MIKAKGLGSEYWEGKVPVEGITVTQIKPWWW